MRRSLTAAAILFATTAPSWTQTARCQGGSDTTGGCPPPMTNSELEAARRLEPRRVVAIPITSSRSAKANSSGGAGFLDNPTSEFNSLQRANRIRPTSTGTALPLTGGASGTGGAPASTSGGASTVGGSSTGAPSSSGGTSTGRGAGSSSSGQ